MRAAWQELQHTGLQACAYLDRGLMGTLATPVEALGSGAMDGSVCKLVVGQLQGLMKAVLERALEQHPDQTARTVLHCTMGTTCVIL